MKTKNLRKFCKHLQMQQWGSGWGMEKQDACMHRQHTLPGPGGIAGAHWEVKKPHFVAVLNLP